MNSGWPICDRCGRNIGYEGHERFKEKVYCYPQCVPARSEVDEPTARAATTAKTPPARS